LSGTGQVVGQPDLPRGGLHLAAPGVLARDIRISGGGRSGRRPGSWCCRALQAGDDLIVGGLGEIGVELADGEEVPRGVHADQFVGGARDPRLPPLRRDRHGEHHPGGAVRPRDLAGGPGRGPGGDAVVDHHGGPASQRLARPAPPVPRGAGVHLRLLTRLHRGQLVRGHPGQADDLAVDHPHPVLPDRAHPELRLERHPELADHDHIQRRAQRPGHLQRNRDTAPRQAEDDHRLAPQVLQPDGQLPPRIGTIGEKHDSLPVASLPAENPMPPGTIVPFPKLAV
jgi:hypothetical protein